MYLPCYRDFLSTWPLPVTLMRVYCFSNDEQKREDSHQGRIKVKYDDSSNKVTGKSLAHFFPNFFVAPMGEGGQFWN